MNRPELLAPVDAAWFRMDAHDDPADIIAGFFDEEMEDWGTIPRTLRADLV